MKPWRNSSHASPAALLAELKRLLRIDLRRVDAPGPELSLLFRGPRKLLPDILEAKARLTVPLLRRWSTHCRRKALREASPSESRSFCVFLLEDRAQIEIRMSQRSTPWKTIAGLEIRMGNSDASHPRDCHAQCRRICINARIPNS